MQSSDTQPDLPHTPLGSGSAPGAGGACGGPGGPSGCRLNLLLSFGGWQADSWADRLPTLLAPAGVQSLRARSAAEAADLIRSYPVHVAVVDLRLPYGACAQSGADSREEAGPKVLELLARLPSPPPTIVVKRGRSARDDAREMHHALRVGAFAAIDPPVNIEDMLRLMQRVLNRFYGGRWPGAPAVSG